MDGVPKEAKLMVEIIPPDEPQSIVAVRPRATLSLWTPPYNYSINSEMHRWVN